MQTETAPRPALSERQLLLGATGLELALHAMKGRLSASDALALSGPIMARIALSDDEAAAEAEEVCREDA